jgi:hypothetical protein
MESTMTSFVREIEASIRDLSPIQADDPSSRRFGIQPTPRTIASNDLSVLSETFVAGEKLLHLP